MECVGRSSGGELPADGVLAVLAQPSVGHRCGLAPVVENTLHRRVSLGSNERISYPLP
jgi:hypothetical protein